MKNSKFIVYFGVTSTLVLGLSYWLWPKSNFADTVDGNAKESTQKSHIKESHVSTTQRVDEVFAKPRSLNAVEAAKPNSVSETQAQSSPIPLADCTKLWNSLADLDLTGISEGNTDTSFFPVEDSCSSVPEQLSHVHDAYQQLCAESEGRDHRECFIAAVIYRGAITDYRTKNLSPGEISDPAVLADKVLTRIAADPLTAGDYAERLLEIMPNFPPAAEAVVISTLAKSLQDQNLNIENLDRQLERFRDVPGINRDLLSEVYVTALANKYGNDADPEKIAKDYAKQFSAETAELNYVTSWANFHRQDLEKARAYLDKALALKPDHPAYLRSRDWINEMLNTGKMPEEPAYHLHLGIDPEKLIEAR